MRADTWHEILDSLIETTQSRRADWVEDADSGAYLLARTSGSVVVRGGRQVVGQSIVEIKSAGGAVVDRLGDRDFDAGAEPGDGHIAVDDFDALDALEVKARRLHELIAEGGSVSEDVARRILREI